MLFARSSEGFVIFWCVINGDNFAFVPASQVNPWITAMNWFDRMQSSLQFYPKSHSSDPTKQLLWMEHIWKKWISHMITETPCKNVLLLAFNTALYKIHFSSTFFCMLPYFGFRHNIDNSNKLEKRPIENSI